MNHFAMPKYQALATHWYLRHSEIVGSMRVPPVLQHQVAISICNEVRGLCASGITATRHLICRPQPLERTGSNVGNTKHPVSGRNAQILFLRRDPMIVPIMRDIYISSAGDLFSCCFCI